MLDVLPTALEMFLVGRELDRLNAREWRLARLLEPLARHYDQVLIDCPPALDVLTDNALAACGGVVIPVQPEQSSVRALRLLLGQITGLESALRRQRIELRWCQRRGPTRQRNQGVDAQPVSSQGRLGGVG
jgi:chromosome partitioning protein